jgi:hypothetical protein
MAGVGGAEIDRVLEIVVGEINSLAEPQADGCRRILKSDPLAFGRF